jgi:hypothetical protein
MKKYRLNYDWSVYEKGYVFEVNEGGYFDYLNGYSFRSKEVELLLLSGALTEITEEKVELPEELPDAIAPDGWRDEDIKMWSTINKLIRYLKSKEK